MPASLALFSGLSRSSTVPLGSLAKASSVGAKTVKGPALLRVSTRPAAPRAAARVVKLPAPTAVSTMSFISAFLGAAAAAFLGAAAARTGARAAPRRAAVRGAATTTRVAAMAVEKELAIVVVGWVRKDCV